MLVVSKTTGWICNLDSVIRMKSSASCNVCCECLKITIVHASLELALICRLSERKIPYNDSISTYELFDEINECLSHYPLIFLLSLLQAFFPQRMASDSFPHFRLKACSAGPLHQVESTSIQMDPLFCGCPRTPMLGKHFLSG